MDISKKFEKELKEAREKGDTKRVEELKRAELELFHELEKNDKGPSFLNVLKIAIGIGIIGVIIMFFIAFFVF